MSDYHILTVDKNKKKIDVVFHIPIPSSGTNVAGISWRDALVLELGGSGNIVSVLPGISTQEDTDMKAGVLFEKRESVRFSSTNLTDAQRRTEVETRFTELSTDIITEKQNTLRFMGVTGET